MMDRENDGQRERVRWVERERERKTWMESDLDRHRKRYIKNCII